MQNQLLLKRSINSLLKFRIHLQSQCELWRDDKEILSYYKLELEILQDHLDYLIKEIDVKSYYRLQVQ